jgi:uncharacterized surface protein with fasciclin (FAS1) repeats
VFASNGVIHVIDKVILPRPDAHGPVAGPPAFLLRQRKFRPMKKFIALAALALAGRRAQAKDIVDTAVAAGNFKTLGRAAGRRPRRHAQGPGPFTVFAPTDAAFAKIPRPTSTRSDKARLTAVLTYHVVPGKVMAKDVKAGKVKTVQGSELTVHQRRRHGGQRQGHGDGHRRGQRRHPRHRHRRCRSNAPRPAGPG